MASTVRRSKSNSTVSERVQETEVTRSEAEATTKAILAALDELGGKNVGEDSLLFQGTQFILPESLHGDISAAVDYLQEWDEQQNTEFEFSHQFNYRPFDGAAAFERAMKRVFGSSGIGKATATMFGRIPPRYRSISSGSHGETLQVPWGDVTFSPLSATFTLDANVNREFGLVFDLSVTAPRRHRRRIEGFFDVIERELREHSIYKGKAITPDGMEPAFVNTDGVDPAQVIYRQEVMTQLEVNLWAPLKYSDALRNTGVPLKRAVLVEGPNGTGKTLSGLLTAQIAEANGWTFILVRAGDDPFEALNSAKMYAPAVVWIEDLDVIAGTDSVRNRAQVSKVLDALDGVQGKGLEVMAGFTTNFAEKLDKGVMRPGRLDAVIHIAELDANGYERLVRALLPNGLLAPDVDFGEVTASYEGFLPAFAAEAAQRAVRYSIARNQGKPDAITTHDLVSAANGMRDHLRLMEDAQHGGQKTDTLDDKLAELVRGVVDGTKGNMHHSDHGGYDITFSEADGK